MQERIVGTGSRRQGKDSVGVLRAGTEVPEVVLQSHSRTVKELTGAFWDQRRRGGMPRVPWVDFSFCAEEPQKCYSPRVGDEAPRVEGVGVRAESLAQR